MRSNQDANGEQIDVESQLQKHNVVLITYIRKNIYVSYVNLNNIDENCKLRKSRDALLRDTELSCINMGFSITNKLL